MKDLSVLQCWFGFLLQHWPEGVALVASVLNRAWRLWEACFDERIPETINPRHLRRFQLQRTSESVMSQLEVSSGTSKDSEQWSEWLTPVAGIWDEKKRKKSGPKFGLFNDDKKHKIEWPYLGPGGGLGIGCGAGVGIGITGGAGVGVVPWNALRFVLGVGFGCGVGLGYGYGQGYGILWDRRPRKTNEKSKRVIIEI